MLLCKGTLISLPCQLPCQLPCPHDVRCVDASSRRAARCQACVDARVSMYTADKEEELLAGSPDFVLDAIDNIDTKVTGPVWGGGRSEGGDCEGG